MRKNQLKKKQTVRRNNVRRRAHLTIKVLLGVLVLMAVSGGFIFTYEYFIQTTHFQADRIIVIGQEQLSRQQVLDIAGIKYQVNILSVNLTTVRKQLLNEPWIADATVRRKIPSELSIHIREEKPLAVLEIPNGQRFLINVAGQVFKRADPSEVTTLPVVTGLTTSDLPTLRSRKTRSLQAVMTLFHLAAKKNSPLPLKKIKRVSLDREIGVTVFTTKENRTVKLGFGHYKKKVEVFGLLMDRLRKIQRFADVKLIDLFDVNRIVIRPVSQPTD